MFEHSQDLYDFIYTTMGKDYLREAEQLRGILAAHGFEPGAGARRPRLLDVACGTGQHLARLDEFDRVGVDLDPKMLEIARERTSDVVLLAGDMLDLDPKMFVTAEHPDGAFEVVACLFSSIAYLADTDELQQAVAGMAACLRPGGLLLVEPFIEPGQYRDGYLDPFLVESPDRSVARMSSTRLEGNTMHLELHYLLGDAGGVRSFVESHPLTLYERGEIAEAMTAAGLSAVYVEDGLMGRGMHVGVRG